MDEDVQDLWNLSIKLLSGKRFNIWHTQSSSVVHVNAMSLLWWVKSRLSFFWRRCWNFTIADSACGITLFIHRYRNETNTVHQLQLNHSTNIHHILRFMKKMCVITIQLNTLTDVPYQMTVGGAFVYVCENLWKRLRNRFWTTFVFVYNAVFIPWRSSVLDFLRFFFS